MLRAAGRWRSSPPIVAVGLSGGVDSAVTALLLCNAGFVVRPLFMRNWNAHDEGSGAACDSADLASAKAVASALGLQLRETRFEAAYWTEVFQPFLRGLSAGKTPNPDVSCNSRVKFGAFRAHALAQGADLIAFGHYARVWPPALGATCPAEAAAEAAAGAARLGLPLPNRGMPIIDACPADDDASWHLSAEHMEGHATGPAILAAADRSKDQSDFLVGVSGAALKRVLLPLGGLLKADVRRVARAAGLPNASRRDSMGICFVGKRDMREFLSGYMPLSTARVLDIDSGAEIATTDAAETWTVGQRARIAGAPKPYYVAAVRLDPPAGKVAGAATSGTSGGGGAATVFAAAGHSHPALLCDAAALPLRHATWVRADAGTSPALPAALQPLHAHAHARRQRGGAPPPPPTPPLPPAAAPSAPLPRALSTWLRPAVVGGSIPSLPVRYRVRHRQTDFQRGHVLLLWQEEWNAAVACALLEAQQRVAAAASNGCGGSSWACTSLLRTLPALTTSALAAAAGHVELAAAAATTAEGQGLILVTAFERLQRAVAPGQELVLYSDADADASASANSSSLAASNDAWADAGRELLGGGPVEQAGPSAFHLALPAAACAEWVE